MNTDAPLDLISRDLMHCAEVIAERIRGDFSVGSDEDRMAALCASALASASAALALYHRAGGAGIPEPTHH